MNRIKINGVLYESEETMSIVNNQVICDGPYFVNGKLHEKPKSVSDKGQNIVTRSFDISDINTLRNGAFNVSLVIDPKNDKEEIVIKASEDAQRRIIINFKDSSLSLQLLHEVGNAHNYLGDFDIVVKAKSLEKVISSGIGNISGKVVSDELHIRNDGNGSVRLEGQVNRLGIDNAGIGNVDALGLNAKEVFFDNSGIGNIQFVSEQVITGINSGIGKVSYYADTPAAVRELGLGSVVYLGKHTQPNINNESIAGTMKWMREKYDAFFDGQVRRKNKF